uniref:Phage protein n=1 Tax=Heterorhabditis bacteriophora TaxID=37862 RepID=A0A1I7W9T1_HETBA
MVTSYLPYVIGIVTTIFTKAELNSEKWGYVSEESWKGTCNTGLAQSPIDLDLGEKISVNQYERRIFNIK